MVLEWIPPESVYLGVSARPKRGRLVFWGRTGLEVPVSFLESFDGTRAASYASTKYLIGVCASESDS